MAELIREEFMKLSRKYGITALILTICLVVSACFGGKEYQALDPYVPSDVSSEGTGVALEENYAINAVVVTSDSGAAHESTLQHLQQSNLVQLQSSEIAVSDWLAVQQLNEVYDLVLVDSSLAKIGQKELQQLIDKTRKFAEGGGTVWLPHEFVTLFPADLTGIKETVAIDSTSLEFTYPEVDHNLQSMQSVWREFTETYKQYNGLNPEFHINHEYGAVLDTAKPIVALDDAVLFAANQVGKGTVLWTNRFLPNQQFITRTDFQPEAEQKYFHFGYATANYMFHTEMAAYAAKEKFGYSLLKAYGPYGRPGLAWQNHYEEAYSYVLEDMITWTDLLYENKQIPTFSLVRSSYNGGQWHSSIAWNENIGSKEQPKFAGSNEHTLFSSGVRMQTEQDYLDFNRYPEYNSLMSNTELPYRAYMTAVDWDGDGLLDLVAGEAEGKVLLLKQKQSDAFNLFEQPVEIKNVKTTDYAAPTAADLNGDGKWDLIVGDGAGKLFYYENNGSEGNPSFAAAKAVVDETSAPITVTGPAAPYIADWNNDGVVDLLIGDGEGFVHLFVGKQVDQTIQWSASGKLQAGGADIQVKKNAAPAVADWDGDGKVDLLVGSNAGPIQLFTRTSGESLTDAGPIQAEHYNFYGNQDLMAGKNVIPLVVDWNKDGQPDLLTGHMEYGIPRPIDLGFFPYKEEVLKNTKYAVDRYIPLIPHMFLHSNLTDEQEKNQVKLHKEMFKNLGLEWENDMGVNHHTWRVNNDILRTFKNQAASGIWWNFGFNPPYVSTAPRDGVEFLLGMPFDLSKQMEIKGIDDESIPFVLNVPAPHILNFNRAWDALATFNMPLTYFEHIEHGLKKGSDIYNKHISQINALNDFRAKYNYTFMTEQQMARSLLNTFHGQVDVTMQENGFTLSPDMSKVPWQVKEYENTLGIRLDVGEKFSQLELNTDSWYYSKDERAYYIGLDKPVHVQFVEKSTMDERIYISKTNTPVQIEKTEDTLKVTLGTSGMQEITFYSPVPLEFTEKLDFVERNGDFYTVIHYGEPITFEVKALKK
ncbi:FG-GAP repeat domain-containing protein [Paenibacillus yanchengensis]|uniref:FG-GAP repeat domain-containing protein n=1 Tax=Paenibacillus yanchengensis TaxID=2035833 RepID=A0ABW4YQE0_9BACL